jgi:hypothetical protein
MKALRKRLELEALEARETPSAGSLAFSGFDPISLQGMVGLFSGQLAAYQQATAHELSQLSSLLGSAVQTMPLALNGSGAALLLLGGAPGSQSGMDPNT